MSREETVNTLHCDMFMACFLQKYKDEIPQIARVVNISSVDIGWWMGSYSGRCANDGRVERVSHGGVN